MRRLLVSLTLLLPALATATPLPTGADRRFGLADVLHCYSVARRLAPLGDPACDDDRDGQVGLAEALLWYAIFTRVRPAIAGADVDAVPPGGLLTLNLMNVAADADGLGVELLAGGISRPPEILSAAGASLRIRVPPEVLPGTEAVIRIFVNRRPSNRMRVAIVASEVCPVGAWDLDDDGICEYLCDPTGDEVCDGLDNDCDGEFDEGFDLLTDTAHCGACGSACLLPRAAAACVGGQCVIAACMADRSYDLDGISSNGCEYLCPMRDPIPEVCDGADNDCDGEVDEGFNLATDPNHCGACGRNCVVDRSGEYTCARGRCVIVRCPRGRLDLDGDPLNGCEYACVPASPAVEACNGVDDDCDGFVDEGFDLQNDPNNCGRCGTRCQAPTGHCVGGACVPMPCPPGRHDLDGNPANGCEYVCEKAGNLDVPDVTFRDSNCDGVDGDVNRAVFVAPAPVGRPDAAGTIDAPLSSVNAAIARVVASPNREYVIISAGTYDETVTMVNGVSLYGSYAIVAPRQWQRRSHLEAPTRVGAAPIGLIAEGISDITFVWGLRIRGDRPAQSGGSSVGVLVEGSTGLFVVGGLIEAVGGAHGLDGAAGVRGDDGGEGRSGGPGCKNCGSNYGGAGPAQSACGAIGGRGGDGGYGLPTDPLPSFPPTAGVDGAVGSRDPICQGFGGGSPGMGGGIRLRLEGLGSCLSPTCTRPGTGGPGTDGADGHPGCNGAMGAGPGTLGPDGRLRPPFGGVGGRGQNGGGGGGGAGGQGTDCCIDDAGNGGASGGGGGCGGGAGQGGQGGGAAIGVQVRNGNVVLSDVHIVTGDAGNGGRGGAGADGGRGALGGQGQTSSAHEAGGGGSGGRGGDAGRGGCGGAGPGGRNHGILHLRDGDSATADVTFALGNAGQGGTDFCLRTAAAGARAETAALDL